jgi:hypothetical protein
MPKYIADKVFGHYLYFTSFCTIEAMHVHASDKKLTEQKSAKFFVRLSMYALWSTMSSNGFYVGK